MPSPSLQPHTAHTISPTARSATLVTKRPDLDLFCQALIGLTPDAEYHDDALLNSLNRQLTVSATKTALVLKLAALPNGGWPDEASQVEWSADMSHEALVDALPRLAAHVVNPDNEPWLDAALHAAIDTPGMRALSLADGIRVAYPALSPQSLIALATVLLMPSLQSSRKLSESLPGTQRLQVNIPPLETWSAVRNADELFTQSGIELLCVASGPDITLRFKPREVWHALIQTAQFQSVFAPMLASMGWYGGWPGERASPAITQALAGRAVIDHFVGTMKGASESLESALRRGWVCEHSHVGLRDRIRELIRAHCKEYRTSTVDLLHYLFLRETMPELLIEGVPDHLQYGRSLESVALLHGVALVEALTPGLSEATPYDALIKVSADLAHSSDPGVHALWAQTLIIPALRYAIAHGAIEWSAHDNVRQATAGQITQALTYLKDQQGLHADELNRLLSLQPPDRRQLAQQMLKDRGIPHWLWDQGIHVDRWPVLQNAGFTVAASYTVDRLMAAGRPHASVVELVMMGEVYIDGWPTVPEAYASAFDLFQTTLMSAQTSIIRRLLSEMSTIDRQTLLNATCELSRVRFDSQQGTQGIFIRCQPGNHLADFHGHSVIERFFELIPASGVVREIPQAFTYEVEDVTWSGTVSIAEAFHRRDEHLRRIEHARVTPLRPMDSDAYLTGAASRSSSVYHQPQQGTLIPSAELIYLAEADPSRHLDILAAKAAAHVLADFLEHSKTLHRHDTQWEKIWAREREYADIAARLIIPFYGCIKDLASGDHSAGTVAGCAIDTAFALIPLGQFAGSTARIVMRAGEMSVESLATLTCGALSTLVSGLAKQSAVLAVRDLGRFALKTGVSSWAGLLNEVPSLRTVFSSPGLLESSAGLDRGMYRLAGSLASPLESSGASLDRLARVEGRTDVYVRNVGTPEHLDFRLLDPQSDSAFGKRLTLVSAGQAMEFSVLSVEEHVGPEHYPRIAPVASIESGIHEVRVAESSRVQAIEREEGVFDILIDDDIYHLDANAPDAALRKLMVEKLSSRSARLQEVENRCRIRRDLIQIPCTSGVKLATPAPEPFTEGSGSPTRTGKYPSRAMAAREFGLSRLSSGNDAIDVFVDEGKICKWVTPSEGASSSVAAQVVPLSESERALFALPEAPNYLTEFSGVLSADAQLGLPEHFPLQDAQWIYEHAPVVQLGAIASGVKDARALRGIRMTLDGGDWIFIEADTGIFYKATTPVDGALSLAFTRVTHAADINEYIRLSEQYRVFRERPGALADQQNIARLLFDLLDDEDKVAWGVRWSEEITTYDEYVSGCRAHQQKNELLEYAANILAGEASQKKFVELARNSIADFLRITERTAEEKESVVEILNTLLPVQESSVPAPSAAWNALTVEKIGTSKAAKSIARQINGANLSYIEVVTEEEQRIVYYALSAGEKASAVKLRIDVVGEAEQVINGVIYRDARALMKNLPPDPGFTSLPVIRDADTVRIREFGRYHDSERLIATVIKRDMQGRSLRSMKVFTLMDTCRSCGGFVLPRLKLDFPDARFSVTFLRNYGAS